MHGLGMGKSPPIGQTVGNGAEKFQTRTGGTDFGAVSQHYPNAEIYGKVAQHSNLTIKKIISASNSTSKDITTTQDKLNTPSVDNTSIKSVKNKANGTRANLNEKGDKSGDNINGTGSNLNETGGNLLNWNRGNISETGGNLNGTVGNMNGTGGNLSGTGGNQTGAGGNGTEGKINVTGDHQNGTGNSRNVTDVKINGASNSSNTNSSSAVVFTPGNKAAANTNSSVTAVTNKSAAANSSTGKKLTVGAGKVKGSTILIQSIPLNIS